jgi:hypothetical protein
MQASDCRSLGDGPTGVAARFVMAFRGIKGESVSGSAKLSGICRRVWCLGRAC